MTTFDMLSNPSNNKRLDTGDFKKNPIFLLYQNGSGHDGMSAWFLSHSHKEKFCMVTLHLCSILVAIRVLDEGV